MRFFIGKQIDRCLNSLYATEVSVSIYNHFCQRGFGNSQQFLRNLDGTRVKLESCKTRKIENLLKIFILKNCK